MEFPLDYVRGCFPALEETRSVYLDNATAPRPLGAVRAVRENGNGHAGVAGTLDETRRSLAYFLNSNESWVEQEIRLAEDVETITAALSATLAETFEPGSEILVTELDDESSLAPWLALAERGFEVRFWPIERRGAALDLDRLESLLTERTRLVVMPKASSVVGTIVELLPIAIRVREHPAMLLVNWTPFLAHGAIDVRFLRCDFVVASTEPLFGSRLGFLWGRKERMRELGSLGVDQRDVDAREVAGLGAALGYVEELGLLAQDMQLQPSEDYARRRHMRRGMQSIRHYERELTSLALRRLSDVPGLTLFGIKDADHAAQRTPTLFFRLSGIEPAALASELESLDVHVCHGSCGAPRLVDALGLSPESGGVRASLSHYNTEEEVNRFAHALHDIAHRSG